MKNNFTKNLLISFLTYSLLACSSKPDNCEITADGDCIIHSPDEAILRQQPLNSFPNLTAKPIYWQGDALNRYPKAIDFPYVYIKKSDGLWVRYKNFPNMDIFLGFTTPKGYVYQEIYKPQSIPTTIRRYSRAINLTDMATSKVLYQQSLYTIDVAYWTEFDTDYYARLYPLGFENIHKKLQLLQTNVANFPENKHQVRRSADKDNEKNTVLTGNKVYPPLNFSTIFNWQLKNGIKQTVEFNADSKSKFWSIGSKDYNLVIEQFAENKYNWCDKDRNTEIELHFIKSEPFAIPDDFEINNHYQLKQGYRLQDITAYQLQSRLFINKQPDYKTKKPREEWQYEVQLLDKNNNMINEICGGENWLPKEP